uniref:Large ribosomal subunit protein uL22c n=1 Tax=Mosla hangchowensis TaxID=2006540 RepID=A0AAU7EM71_9LAMI|nr:ribosomal protein L22 [Mosla dianthera]YP_010989118.1 ribosomal protein L22 [Mosla scabra]WOR85767.1 ribosomal protein L22 [Mosla dianthera]WOR85852.1 ribosomal protein L22 [Mosla scabra]
MLLRKKKTEVCALGRHISISADKARRVIDQIRGHSYEETLMILELMPYKACYPIFKLVYSAAANASYTMGSAEANLVIIKAEVNEGTTVKKFKPQARGRSYAIKKATCHITIVVKDISLDEYEDISFNSLKNPRWKNTTIANRDVYNSEVVWDKK